MVMPMPLMEPIPPIPEIPPTMLPIDPILEPSDPDERLPLPREAPMVLRCPMPPMVGPMADDRDTPRDVMGVRAELM